MAASSYQRRSKLFSWPSQVAIRAGSRSDLRRIRTASHSGSPKRTLNSTTLGAAVGRDHQAGVEQALVGPALGLHAGHQRPDHLCHDAFLDRGGHHRCGRIGAHAAGVGALVSVVGPLVVLRGGQGRMFSPSTKAKEARLFALEKLFDHQFGAGARRKSPRPWRPPRRSAPRAGSRPR